MKLMKRSGAFLGLDIGIKLVGKTFFFLCRGVGFWQAWGNA